MRPTRTTDLRVPDDRVWRTAFAGGSARALVADGMLESQGHALARCVAPKRLTHALVEIEAAQDVLGEIPDTESVGQAGGPDATGGVARTRGLAGSPQ
jgi:hypothetical protein